MILFLLSSFLSKIVNDTFEIVVSFSRAKHRKMSESCFGSRSDERKENFWRNLFFLVCHRKAMMFC